MDEREADAVWRRFTDTDKAAKRGHGIGFDTGHSVPFEGSFHEKESLQARFKRAEAPKNEDTGAEKEPVSVRDRIRARVVAAMRESKQQEKVEDSKWSHFTTQKRREMVGLQSIVDDRGCMLGTEYTYTEQDHADLDNAIAAATQKPDSGKKAAEEDHAAAIFGAPMPSAGETREGRAKSPRNRDSGRNSRHRGEDRDRERDRDIDRDRHRERSSRHETDHRHDSERRGVYNRDKDSRGYTGATDRDSGRYRGRDREIERRHRDRGRYERGAKGSRGSPERRAGSPVQSRQRDRDRRDGDGYRSSRHDRSGREEGRHNREGDSGHPQSTHARRGETEHDRDRDRCRVPAGHEKIREDRYRESDRERGRVGERGANRGWEKDKDEAQVYLASGRAHNNKSDPMVDLNAGERARVAGTVSQPRNHLAVMVGDGAVGQNGEVGGGGGVQEWEGIVPEGAVVVELDAQREEPEERHADLDNKFGSLAKSSWRDRLAARS